MDPTNPPFTPLQHQPSTLSSLISPSLPQVQNPPRRRSNCEISDWPAHHLSRTYKHASLSTARCVLGRGGGALCKSKQYPARSGRELGEKARKCLSQSMALQVTTNPTRSEGGTILHVAARAPGTLAVSRLGEWVVCTGPPTWTSQETLPQLTICNLAFSLKSQQCCLLLLLLAALPHVLAEQRELMALLISGPVCAVPHRSGHLRGLVLYTTFSATTHWHLSL